ncbi:hypothetical protein H0H81_012470 [Sphagnurus paluster]|uniref:Fanconi-associated nuclease n=1 Tax=Sphagnurus paluster TaxID=117069 RepID=A0A9P7GMT1_9AGAR|nr:hypothetical protein H0H81_012470 [Sphagnurus paluster]
MNAASPPATALYELLYCEKPRDDGQLENDIEQLDSETRGQGLEGVGKPISRSSIYITTFEKMVNVVYCSEEHLLTPKEINFLDEFSKLSYSARYCLVRLILRKANNWHTLASMDSFKKEVKESDLPLAIEELCLPVPTQTIKEEKETVPVDIVIPAPEVIDLTLDSEEEEEKKPILHQHAPSNISEQDVKPSLGSLDANLFSYEPNFDFFLEDESSMDLTEVLHKLNNDQLKDLVKQTKTKPDKMRASCFVVYTNSSNNIFLEQKMEMIHALTKYAYTQTPLPFLPVGKGKNKTDGLLQTTLPFKSKANSAPETQHHRLMQMALKKLGKSVRVNSDFCLLVARLNVIYDRCTQYPDSFLTPSLLTSFKKRTYPDYNYQRDGTIWRTRQQFLDYFEALYIAAAIEHELEAQPASRSTTKTPAPIPGGRDNSMTPALRRIRTTPMSGTSSIRFTESPIVFKKENGVKAEVGEAEVAEAPEEPIKLQMARRVKEYFEERILPKWKALLQEKIECCDEERSPALERFEPGFIYVRIFGKVMRALATLKLYQEELNVVEALLGQTFWRRGKRAKWYERRAILQTRYLCFEEHSGEKRTNIDVLHQAMAGLRQALEDEDTGIVFRPSFVQRLQKLEKRLKVPEEERVKCEGELRKAGSVEFHAERVFRTSNALTLDANGRPSDGAAGKKDGLQNYFATVAKGERAADKENGTVVKPPVWKGKSIWRGIDGGEVSVEDRALQHYKILGYKGFHSETRILTTIFALLFWDIIFADVPGAFETKYQTAPLDLAEDSFYRARKQAIETRLKEIQDKSRAQELLRRHDDAHRDKKTFCVGVQWDMCEQQDLLDRRDYMGRSSGVPDLIIWHAEKGICKFVEVKGPGDRPQENQKLWFDSLLAAEADVEICNVIDINNPPVAKSARRRKTTRSSTKSNSKGKGETRKEVDDSDDGIDYDSDQVDQLDEDPWDSPSSILGKRSYGPSDEPPTHPSSTAPPISPSDSSRQQHQVPFDTGQPSAKRQKMASVVP